MSRQGTGRKATTTDVTTRVPVVDFAQTRVFRQARSRTPVRPMAAVTPGVSTRIGAAPLAHPRLVRRAR